MIFSPNTIAWPIALLGLIAGGVRATLANSAYTPAELAFQYNDSRARLVFAYPDLIPIVFAMFKHIGVSEDEARRRLVVLDFGGNGAEVARKVGVLGLSDLLGHGALPEEEKFSGPQAGETLLLCYSSGTTGKPKGVEVCCSKFLSNLADVVPDDASKSYRHVTHGQGCSGASSSPPRCSTRCSSILSHLWYVSPLSHSLHFC